MSIINEALAPCSKCGQQTKVTVYRSINISENPELKAKVYEERKQQVLDDVKVIRDIEDEYGIKPSDYFYGQTGLTSILSKIEKDINVKSSSLIGARVKQVFDGHDWFAPKGNQTAIRKVSDSVNIVALYKKLIEDHKKLFYVSIIKKNLYLYALRGTLLNVILKILTKSIFQNLIREYQIYSAIAAFRLFMRR